MFAERMVCVVVCGPGCLASPILFATIQQKLGRHVGMQAKPVLPVSGSLNRWVGMTVFVHACPSWPTSGHEGGCPPSARPAILTYCDCSCRRRCAGRVFWWVVWQLQVLGLVGLVCLFGSAACVARLHCGRLLTSPVLGLQSLPSKVCLGSSGCRAFPLAMCVLGHQCSGYRSYPPWVLLGSSGCRSLCSSAQRVALSML